MLKFKFTEDFITRRSKELLGAMAVIRGVAGDKHLAHWERNNVDYVLEMLTKELASVLETYNDTPQRTPVSLLDDSQIDDIPF